MDPFLARIADSPDDDLARLVYADWLAENGRDADAERIRLAVKLDPDRDRYDDPAVNALRDQVDALTPKLDLPAGVEVEWRRGLPDSLCVPAPLFVEHGEQLRCDFPTARRLVLFRLNGWGDRVAVCEALAGVRELELACWYADADADALAASPYVAGVERLVLWSGDNQDRVTAAFLAGVCSRQQCSVRLVDAFLDGADWLEQVHGQADAALRCFFAEPISIAPDFRGDEFIVGKLPDGSQVFAVNDISEPRMFGLQFTAAGATVGPFHLGLPPELALDGRLYPASSDGWTAYWAAEKRAYAARRAFAVASGVTPAFVRVEPFSIFASDDIEADPYISVSRYRGYFEDAWGRTDDPDDTPARKPGGHGATAYRYVRGGEYTAVCEDEWWCDRRGRVYRA